MINPERIILVDDNELDNVFHEIVIRKAGFKGEVRVFESGIDFLAFWRNDDQILRTCIFLDINMPLLNGFEVARRVSSVVLDTTCFELHMLTSSGSVQDRQIAGSIPCVSSYLVKPLAREFLIERFKLGR